MRTRKDRRPRRRSFASGPSFSATAVGNGGFQQYGEELAPRGEGWEYVESLNMPGNAAKWASLAVEKLGARSVEPGRYDLILTPENLWLTIHESIGHPTELDRAMGYEANYAGTTFVAPPEAQIGKLKYGRRAHEHPGRSHAGRLAGALSAGTTKASRPTSCCIVKNGIFKDYQTTREQACGSMLASCTGVDALARLLVRRLVGPRAVPAHAERLAAAGREGHRRSNDIIAATDRGIVIRRRLVVRSTSSATTPSSAARSFYEIKGGKIIGMLKDVAYQIRDTRSSGTRWT